MDAAGLSAPPPRHRPCHHRVWVILAIGLSSLFPATSAASTQSTLRVEQGPLGISPSVAVSDFVEVTLDGTARTTSATLDAFSVVDARGSGAGWTLMVSATVFSEWDGSNYVVGGRSLPAGSLSMAAPSVVAQGTDSAPPTLDVGPYAIDGAAVTIASASAHTGMGSYLFTHPDPLMLAVPASAHAATYRSEITFSVTSGP